MKKEGNVGNSIIAEQWFGRQNLGHNWISVVMGFKGEFLGGYIRFLLGKIANKVNFKFLVNF